MAQNGGGGYPPPDTSVGNNAECWTQYPQKVLHQQPPQIFPQQPPEHFVQQLPDQYPQQPQHFPQQPPQYPQEVLHQQPPQQFPQEPPKIFPQQPLEHFSQQPQHFPQQPQVFSQQLPLQLFEQPSDQFSHLPPQQYPPQPPQQYPPQPPQQNPQWPPQRFHQQSPQQFHQQPPEQLHQQYIQQYPEHHQQNFQQHPSPYAAKHLAVTVQIGVQHQYVSLPCEVHEYFQWFFCLCDRSCLESLKESLRTIGAALYLPENKAPLFMFSNTAGDIVTHLQYFLRETSKKFDIQFEFFSWDLSVGDLKEFCQKYQKEEGTLLHWENVGGRIGVCLVGHKTAFEQHKPFIKAELQKMKTSIPYVDEPVPHQVQREINVMETKIFNLMKAKLELQFQVKIILESGKVYITENTKGAADRVFSRFEEMYASLRLLKLPVEFHTFLQKSEKAQLYIENEMKALYKQSIHFLEFEEKNKAYLSLFEENNMDLGEVEKNICNLVFLVPSQNTLCQIFCTDDGKKSFASIVKENEGKVSMILDERSQACCVGTKDIEEKVKNSMKISLMVCKLIPLPSEEAWKFCKKHWNIRDIEKENSCEVELVQDVKLPWALKIYGPEANVSKCQQKIANEIGKIYTNPVQFIEPSEGSEVNLIERWNAQKRCFASLKRRKMKTAVPWKKWIESRDTGESLTYSVNLNSIQRRQPEDVRIILLPEEQGGVTSKKPFQQLDADCLQMFVPPLSNLKKKDIILQKLDSILNWIKDNLKKKNIVVDCERLQEKELKYYMKLMCFTLHERVGFDLDIIHCEFHDIRPEMFPCMTTIIDDHMKKKKVEVLEWKGRCIEMDMQVGQLAQQRDFNVLVNSTSQNLMLDAGFISKSILRIAGPEIQEECNQNYKYGIKKGKLAITQGYGLTCKHVFHGCLSKYVPSEDFKSLRTMVRNCLETADEMKMESIAFPALGTGNLGYKRKDVANVLYEEVEKYEKDAMVGSLCRVCCVIYQDDVDSIREFQKRHIQWMEKHKSERGQEEVVVTTDDPQVLKEICLEVQQLKSTEVNEPPKSEISESERLGESPEKEDVGKDTDSKQFQRSSKNVEPLSEERSRLLVKMKVDSEEDSFLESEVRKDFKNLTENIVCPFHSAKQALLQFSTIKAAEEALKNEEMKKKYDLQRFPPQAVVDLKAVVSQKMVKLLKERSITADLIRQKSGVLVDQKDPQSMVLCGNILEIKAAFNFLSTLLKSPAMKSKEEDGASQRNDHLNTEMNNSAEKTLNKTKNNSLQGSGREFLKEEADILPEHLQQYGTSSTKLSQVSFTPSMTGLPPSEDYQGQQPMKSLETMTNKPQQPTHEDESMRCTADDFYQLQYFNGNILENVEQKWTSKKTRVNLMFLQHGIKEEVEDMIKKNQQMYRETVKVAKTFESLETFVQQKCSDDLFCYITNDKEKIIITGHDKRKVEKIREECIELLFPETEIEVKSEGSAASLPVFVTNEGISVYVYRDSLLNAKVDAIVCPISKSFDLRGGLPKIIAGLAGPAYTQRVQKILQENGKLPELFVCSIPGGDNLLCKYVVNAVTIPYTKYEHEESKKSLQHLLMQSLFEAEKTGAKSIALPAVCSGKMGYPKDVCANCYASSVVMYSSGIKIETQGLKEIHFVDQSVEMITFIESVFSNPEMIEKVDLQKQRVNVDSSLYPYMEENGTCWLNKYLNICVMNTAISKLKPSPIATLVYNESLPLENLKSVMETIIAKLKGGKKNKGQNARQVGYIEMHSQQDPSRGFLNIMHVVLPTWTSKKSHDDVFYTNMSSCYAKIFEKAIDHSLLDLTLPLYGAEKGNAEVTKRCATCLLNEVIKFGEKLVSLKKSFSILIANGEKSIHDIMLKELRDLVESEQAGFPPMGSSTRKNKPRQMSNIPYGDQPKGTIYRKWKKTSLKGFEKCGTIELHVKILDGIQQKCHPNEGEKFTGRKECIFLPDNETGLKVAKKLITAFNLRILYTVKTQPASKVEMVMHTDIPLKTSESQYPDARYLQTVLKVLNSKIRD